MLRMGDGTNNLMEGVGMKNYAERIKNISREVEQLRKELSELSDKLTDEKCKIEDEGLNENEKIDVLDFNVVRTMEAIDHLQDAMDSLDSAQKEVEKMK